MNTTTKEIPEMYLTLKERIDYVKAGKGQKINQIQMALFMAHGIDFVTFE